MKKLVAILVLVGIIAAIMVGCGQKPQDVEDDSQIEQGNENLNNGSGEIITEPLNQEFEIQKSLESVADISGLNESTKMSEAEIKKSYDFEKYENLEKEIRSEITDDTITEIAIVKIGENDQTQDLFQSVSKRIVQLQQQYADNAKLSSILEDGDNIVVKQQGGILMVIISENAKEIEKKLDEQI